MPGKAFIGVQLKLGQLGGLEISQIYLDGLDFPVGDPENATG